MLLIRLLMVLVLLGTSPAARAVDCVMAMADTMTMDAAHAHCPMMQAALELDAKANAMTVADCFHDVGLEPPAAAFTVERETNVAVIPPTMDVAMVHVPAVRVAFHPPPVPRDARSVLLTSGRWRL